MHSCQLRVQVHRPQANWGRMNGQGTCSASPTPTRSASLHLLSVFLGQARALGQ